MGVNGSRMSFALAHMARKLYLQPIRNEVFSQWPHLSNPTPPPRTALAAPRLRPSPRLLHPGLMPLCLPLRRPSPRRLRPGPK
jgi:hypothetical protein